MENFCNSNISLEESNFLILDNIMKRKISMEIHDNIISKLLACKYFILQNDEKNKIINQISECIKDLREQSHELYFSSFEIISIYEKIATIIEPFNKTIHFELINLGINCSLINKLVSDNLIRIIQELIKNIVLHSHSTYVKIILRISKKYISIILNDNGIGLSNYTNKGQGLKNIDTRIKLLKGSYKIKAKRGTGTKFIIFVKNE